MIICNIIYEVIIITFIKQIIPSYFIIVFVLTIEIAKFFNTIFFVFECWNGKNKSS
jgi:hypothetical protein